ncbi:unnamed protein product, partial [Anisakis simplex]|uniref:Uncharacterized protein n=1 Tax=Anisakis simplex TaxID=6269 RepID=A0A0M3JFR6_ANISI
MERQAMKMQGAASVGMAREATSNTLDSSAPAPYSTLYQPNADDQVPKSMAFDEIPLNSVMRNAELHEMHYQHPSLNANINAFDEKNQQQHQQNILVVGGGGLASLPQPSMASFSSIPISEIPVLSTTTQSPSVAHHSVPATNQPTQTVSGLSPMDASIHSREPIAEAHQQPPGSFGGISQEQKQQINPNTVDAEISSFGTAPLSNPSSNDPVDLNAQPL